MKKVMNFCPVCNKDTLHRKKSISYFRSKKEGYGTNVLPLRCFNCGHEEGKQIKKEKGKRNTYVKVA